jgi:hypothetical protein
MKGKVAFCAMSRSAMPCFFLFALLSALLPLSAQNSSRAEALRVLGLIEKIEQEQLVQTTAGLRTAAVSESELNSYIAYRIETEKEAVMKELSLKLLDKNRIEGKISLDLRGQKLAFFLRPELNFYFEASIVSREGKARLEMKRLFLEEQQVQSALLDLAISIAARLSHSKASSLNDWYELPYGLKSLETQRGQLIVTY